jgi:hypothetical protein
LTAGRGRAGDGEAERRKAEMEDWAGDPENEERRLVEKGGGFMGRETEVGVPGVEGVGDGAIVSETWVDRVVVETGGISGGAGLPDIRRGGKSIREERLYCWKLSCPSRVLRAQMWTDRSLLWVAMYSPSGSHATPWT